ncbi:hypothetical protein [Histidinibacterium lentulum]|uniref:EF-hand domain-containing protein n=1 Tax=Histidinibacterium lentulum TaxID=2480588 RepID=A0A3N2QTX0_9RHOB|nr:hypothetical protein [Histidinibacterium lentulum]ROT98579.1 hypothetical protein EAT49_16710 [Histidinibacterium lentulum]
MNSMTKIIAALAFVLPGAAMAQEGEPMTFDRFQEVYGEGRIDPTNNDRILFSILDTDNDGILSVAEQRSIEDANAPGGDGISDIEVDDDDT